MRERTDRERLMAANDLRKDSCLIVPCYRHAGPLLEELGRLRAFRMPIIVVDDGNAPEESARLAAAASESVIVLRNEENMGKGASVLKGFQKAEELGFRYAVQIDADGQFDTGGIADILAAAEKNPGCLIYGVPVYDRSVNRLRYVSRFITHFWVSIELGRREIIDTMCGLRLYPLKETLEICRRHRPGARMDFDTEIFVRLCWAGVRDVPVPVKVRYIENGVSNFDVLRDNVRISWMHTRLIYEKCLSGLLRLFGIRR